MNRLRGGDNIKHSAEDQTVYKEHNTFERSADNVVIGRTNDLKTEAEEQQSKEPYKKTTNQREGKSSLEVGNNNLKKNIKGKYAPKIYNFLEKHPDEEYTAKAIGIALNILPNTVNHALIRFLKENLIEEPHEGVYKYTQKITPEELKLLLNLESVRIHKLIFRQSRNGGNLRGVRGVKRNVKKCGDSRNPYTEEKFMIKTNCIKIWSYPRKRIISIACTDFPLDSHGLSNVLAILEYIGLDVYNAEILEWELNKDIPGLQMYGCQCIKMKVFLNAFMRIYNKNGKLRVEVNQKDLQITAEQGVALICGNAQYNPAIMKKELDRHDRNEKRLTELLTQNINLERAKKTDIIIKQQKRRKTTDNTPIIRADKLKKCPVCNNSKSLIIQGTKLTCARCGYINDLKN